MRIINFKGPDGENIPIRAIKNEKISNLEILVPYRYKTFFKGFEWWHASKYNMDILGDDIMDKNFNKVITIVNLDPKQIPHMWMVHKSREEAIESYKYVVSVCSAIIIYLNDDNTLSEVCVCYETDDIDYGHPHQEEIFLIDHDDNFSADITSERY